MRPGGPAGTGPRGPGSAGPALPVPGRHPADVALRLPQVKRDGLARLAQPQYPVQVVDRGAGGHVRLVGLRDLLAAAHGEQRARAVLAELADGLLGQVVVPRAHRGRHLGLQLGGVHVGQQLTPLGPHHDVEPRHRRLADHHAVVHLAPAIQRLGQDLLGAEPDLGVVPVAGQVHQAGHVPAVDVSSQEQAGHRGLEQLLAGEVLQELGQVLAVVAVGGHAGARQHVGELAPQHRDPRDALGVSVVGVEAEEPVFARDLPRAVQALDGDVVEITRPVHGRAGVRLGQDQQLRLPGPGAHLGRQRRERSRALPVVPQDAEPGAGHRAQRQPGRPLLQVVLAVAEEREVAVGQPAEQRLNLGA